MTPRADTGPVRAGRPRRATGDPPTGDRRAATTDRRDRSRVGDPRLPSDRPGTPCPEPGAHRAALRTAVGQDPESDAPLPIADSNVAPESEKPEM